MNGVIHCARLFPDFFQIFSHVFVYPVSQCQLSKKDVTSFFVQRCRWIPENVRARLFDCGGSIAGDEDQGKSP